MNRRAFRVTYDPGSAGDDNADDMVKNFDINLISVNWTTGGGQVDPEPQSRAIGGSAVLRGLLIGRGRGVRGGCGVRSIVARGTSRAATGTHAGLGSSQYAGHFFDVQSMRRGYV